MSKGEMYIKLTKLFEDKTTDQIIIYLCNWFDTSDLEHFIEFTKEEQQG
jgi:hypothetical protein